MINVVLLQIRVSDISSNMTRPMPVWYVRSEGRFVDAISSEAFDVAVTRVQKRFDFRLYKIISPDSLRQVEFSNIRMT